MYKQDQEGSRAAIPELLSMKSEVTNFPTFRCRCSLYYQILYTAKGQTFTCQVQRLPLYFAKTWNFGRHNTRININVCQVQSQGRFPERTYWRFSHQDFLYQPQLCHQRLENPQVCYSSVHQVRVVTFLSSQTIDI